METSLHPYASVLLILGRVLLGGLFVVAGIRHLSIVDMLAVRVRTRGIAYPRLVITAGTVLQLAMGAALMFGFFVAPAAFGLVGFTILAGLMLLDFWHMEGDARGQLINAWLSNLAVIGGLLVTAAVEIR